MAVGEVLPDPGVQLLQARGCAASRFLAGAIEGVLRPLQELVLPLVNLVRVDIEAFGQLGQGLLTPNGC